MFQLVLPFVFFASALSAGPVSLPSNFQRCSISAPDLNKCLQSAIQNAKNDLSLEGSKTLGVLPLDPLVLVKLDINQGTGPVAIDLNFSNLSIKGISQATVTSVDAQLTGEEKKITIKLHSENLLSISGHYKIKGNVLVLPIHGEGKADLDLTDTDATIVLTGKLVEKKNVKYLIFNSVEFELSPKHVKLNFENLFNGDKTLGDGMNKFLNENWQVVYGELKDSIQKGFGLTIVEIANRIFMTVPYDDVFWK